MPSDQIYRIQSIPLSICEEIRLIIRMISIEYDECELHHLMKDESSAYIWILYHIHVNKYKWLPLIIAFYYAMDIYFLLHAFNALLIFESC